MLRLAFVVVFVIDETIQYQQLGRVVGATIAFFFFFRYDCTEAVVAPTTPHRSVFYFSGTSGCSYGGNFN